ncbi:response regulator [Robbsia sp. KACC 23696]|uniref:response regulator n=1 Tax=Robbsia sp. KACC 23696 TaxID=3149231 RepID=UPI00325BFA63
METSVLIVDDDPAVRDLLSRYLAPRGYAVATLPDGDGLRARLAESRPSIIVLDVMMPGIDGLQTLAELREGGDDIPVIMVTARDSVGDRVAGLELGADDYIVKPFEPRELMARIDSVLRREVANPISHSAGRTESAEVFAFGRFRFDSQTRRLFANGKPLPLRDSELALLNVFVRHPYKVLGREYLHHLLRGEALSFRDRGFDVPVWRLRRLIEEDPSNPRHLQTVRGKGYVFVPNIEAT